MNGTNDVSLSEFARCTAVSLAILSLGISGCAQLRLPAIDPSGQRIFLPSPTYTTISPQHPGRLFANGPAPADASAPGAGPGHRWLSPLPRPTWGHAGVGSLNDRIHGGWTNCRLCNALSNWNMNRPRLLDLLSPAPRDGCHSGPACGAGTGCRCGFCPRPLFRDPPQPPRCNPDGSSPPGGPAFAIGTAALPPDPPPYGQSWNCRPSCERASAPACRAGNGGSREADLSGAGPFATGANQGLPMPGVSITPRRVVAAVGQEVVLVGGIWHPDGEWLANEPVEWLLSQDSVGSLVDGGVSQRGPGLLGRLLHRARPSSTCRGCNDYLAARTLTECAVLQRGRPDSAGDVYLKRGQTWVSLTSGSEGPSYVTLLATQVPNWSARQQTATIYWVDGQWAFPPPANGNTSAPVDLSTFVVRQTDGSPISNWIVRYQILDGVAAGLDASGVQVIDVPTDLQGRAPVQVYPRADVNGVTRIGVEVIKPRTQPGEPPQLVVGQGQTSINWSGTASSPIPSRPPAVYPPPTTPSAPATSPPATRPPPTASNPPPLNPPGPRSTTLAIGIMGPSEVSTSVPMIGYRIEVRNTGTAVAENVRVIDPVPYGLQYLESTPAGTFLQTDGPQRVEWRLPTLPAGGRETFDVQFRPLDENQVNNVVFAEANNAVRVSNSLPTRIQRPVLGLTVSDPLPPNPQVGQPVRFDIVVENLGSQPLTDVELVDRFEEGLDHVNVKPPSERQLRFPRIERLLPGERQPVPLEFIPNRPGTFCHDVQVTSKEGASDTKRGCVTAIEAQRPSLLVEIQNIPDRMTVGQSADVRILIENDGNIDLNNLRIVFEDQQELQVSAISEGTRREGNQWIATTNPYDGGRPISLPQGARLSWPLKVQAMAPARSACTQVTVEGLNVRRGDQHCTEIVPRDETGTAPGSAVPPGTATPPPAGAATPGQERGGLRLYVNYLGTDASGRLLEFEVSLQNTSATPYREIQLQLTAGPGMRIADILGQGARAASGSQDGTQVQLTPIASIRANETVAFRVQVQPGTQASRALLRADAAGPELRRTLQAQDFAR